MVNKTNKIKIIENENMKKNGVNNAGTFDKNDALGDEVELGEASQAS